MSTLPGLGSKGEKVKPKFQSLNINDLYRVSRGESLETQQQKNTLPRKHGMQSLGKVPTARRPPANLPSLKSENTGTDAAISLVPSGGPGWGKQDTNSSSTSTSPTTPTVTNTNASSPSPQNAQLSAHQAAIALPVTTPIPPSNKHATPTATPATTDKSWSAVMTSSDLIHPPPYQSPQFQHEFPSLSAGDGAPQRTGTDTQYGPGPSLRPQTEGSWMQGGSRTGVEGPPRSSSAPLGVPAQHSAPVGPQQPSPQFRGLIPPFMYKGSLAPNGHNGPNYANNSGTINGRNRVQDNRSLPRAAESDEVLLHRPIIKEEDLNRMDDMTRDVGWATHEDIDYNQKLAFSDDEGEKDHRREKISHHKDHLDQHSQDGQGRNWSARAGSNVQSATPPTTARGRPNEEEELWTQRRRQHNEEVAQAVERAKQRKEEEEKRFLETKQAAAKKLQELEEKLNKSKREKELDDSQGTINPSTVPPQPITPVPIPVPDWEREKESRSRTPSEAPEGKNSEFRQLSQIEGRTFVRNKDTRGEKDSRESNAPTFSRHFQNNLPPRFQKQQQLRNTSNSSPQPQGSFSDQYDPRWQSTQSFNKTSPSNSTRKLKPEEEFDDDHKDYRNEELYRSRSYVDGSRKFSSDSRYNEDGDYKRERDDDRHDRKGSQDLFDEHIVTRPSSEEWRSRDKHDRDERGMDRYERPQRPDSRDSRTSRESRHSRESARDSESREYHGSWADSPFEPAFDDRKKESRDDRRIVPGPITKERIEAEELRSEKKNLTQLKRGQIMLEKKLGDRDEKTSEKTVLGEPWSNDENKECSELTKPWADAGQLVDQVKVTDTSEKSKNLTSVELKKDDDVKSEIQEVKKVDKPLHDKDKEDRRNQSNRRRPQGWGGGFVYRNSWSKRVEPRPNRALRVNSSKKSTSKSGEWHATDSEVSADEISVSTESGKDDRGQRSPKPIKKHEKDERNKDIKHDKGEAIDGKSDSHRRDNYVPRGEPSRHGRGASNFRSRGGLSKRIDGYGPPPSKSPFSSHDDKEKKLEDVFIEPTAGDDKLKANFQSSNSTTRDDHRDYGRRRIDDKSERNKYRNASDSRRNKLRSKGDGASTADDNCDTTSDNSDEAGHKEGKRRSSKPASLLVSKGSTAIGNHSRRNNPPPRLSGDKRNYNPLRSDMTTLRQNSSGSLKGNQSPKMGANKEEKISDEKLKKEEDGDCEKEVENVGICDSDGFQEVSNKKKTKDKQKPEERTTFKSVGKLDKEKIDRKKINGPILTPQQVAHIPALMDTPVNPPPVLPQSSNKGQFERLRQNKLPPRFAKQRENNRLQKVQLQNICDVNDMNKVNHNMNMYGIKDVTSASVSMSNAWDKPLTTQLRSEQDSVLSVGMESCKAMEQTQLSPSHNNSPGNDKVISTKSNQMQDKTVLDGATPPVNTIIFENTNFKTAPGARNTRAEKPMSSKLDDNSIDSAVMTNFNKPIRDLLNKNDKQTDSIPIQISFNKEDSVDMKMDFFEHELSHLTEDKTSKNLGLPRSMQTITSANSTISATTADALNFKIASVKKVWESMPTVIEHSVGQDDANSSFATSFGTDPNTLDPSSAFGKATDTSEDNNEGYSPSSNQAASSSTTNVCKVKPTQQVPGTTGQPVHTTGTHQQHSTVVGPGIVGHPLSPPPMQPVIGAGVGLGQAPQQYATNQHISYQPNIGGSTQYGMSAIPSPPTVLFNSTQQIQAAQSGLYGAFQIDQSQVLGGQGRSQYSQYPNPYSLGQTASSPYSAQSMYLQGSQHHPPPNAQGPPDLYQNMNSYRLPATGPFGQSQQLSNPTTVLISSTSNSLMSATVKPSTQQISAIGTKAGGVGQAYQPQSQQGQQLYMTYDPTIPANYLPNAGVMQRGPSANVQNSVVPALQPSSSYYSGSTGGQSGYFQQPGNSTLQSAQLQQPQAAFGLQGNVFGNPNQSHTNAGLQNYSSHFSMTQLQIAALGAQQYRSATLPNTGYMKGMGSQHMDQNSRPQQIKSPGSQQDVLSSVFNTGPQIPSPKSRQNIKQVPQPSPTAQHKYNLYQSVNSQQSGQVNNQRYPTPIQRPVNFQPVLGSIQTSNGTTSHTQKHRTTHNQSNKPPTRQYYGGQGGTLTQHDKNDDSKLGDSGTSSAPTNVSSSIISKTAIGGNASTVVNQSSDITKDSAKKEENGGIKD